MILKCPEFEVKSKIRKIFEKHNLIEEYSVKVYEIDLYFHKHYEKKTQVDKNGCKYILCRIYVWFNKFLLAVEIDEKGHTDRDLVFEEKRQEALEKTCHKFVTVNTSNAKNGYDLDYEVDNFKNKKIKRTKRQNKRKRRKLKSKNKRTTSQNKRTRRQK